MATNYGSYIGNGTAQSITGLGFPPDIVIVKGDADNAHGAVCKTTSMPTTSSCGFASVAILMNAITSLDGDGFTVWNDGAANKNGVIYHWEAWSVVAGEVYEGSYVGDGTDDRNIVGVGFQSELVLILPQWEELPTWYFGTFVGDQSLDPTQAAAFAANRIQQVAADGFQIGSADEVNRDTWNYFFICFNDVVASVVSGSYVGNGADDRNLAALGINPTYVMLQSENEVAHHRNAAVLTDRSQFFKRDANAADRIQDMIVGGFQVGVNANTNGRTYHYIAFVLGVGPDSRVLTDSGVAVDALHVWKDACAVSEAFTAASFQTGERAWRPSIVALPDAIVRFERDPVVGVACAFSADGGTTWDTSLDVSTAFTFHPAKNDNLDIMAVADICTQDIHLVYGTGGDPYFSDTLSNSIWYRKLTYTGSPGHPAWLVGQEVEVAHGGAGIGYSTPVLAVQRRGCGYSNSIEEGDGRLVMMCIRKTFTTQTWAVFTAAAPWTLQGAVETIEAIPAAAAPAGGRLTCAALSQVADRVYALIFVGGAYVLYRSETVDWGASDVTFAAVDSFSGDYKPIFAMASDYLGSQTDQGGDVLATQQVAVAYGKDGQAHVREYTVPETGDVTVTDQMIWPIQYVEEVSISRVGTEWRVTAEVSWVSVVPPVVEKAVIYADSPYYNAWFAIWITNVVAEPRARMLHTPEHATSGYTWCAAWERYAGVAEFKVGMCPLAVYQLLNESGAGNDTAVIKITVTEGGGGVDVITFVINVADGGGGTEAVTIILEVDDAGGALDLVAKGHAIVESAVGVELLNIAQAIADAGGLSDEALRVGLRVIDVGGGVDALSDNPSLRVSDIGEGGDAFALEVHIAEAVSGVDVPTIGILVPDSNIGVVADALTITLNVADEGVGADVLGKLYTLVDSASGDDVLGILLAQTDSGLGTDSLKIILNVTDTGIGVDQVSLAARVLGLVLRLLVAKGILRLNLKGPEL